MGHASIGETAGTCGHLVRERPERDVDHLDAVLGAVSSTGESGGTPEPEDSERPAASLRPTCDGSIAKRRSPCW
jgi:hypothetical protein